MGVIYAKWITVDDNFFAKRKSLLLRVCVRGWRLGIAAIRAWEYSDADGGCRRALGDGPADHGREREVLSVLLDAEEACDEIEVDGRFVGKRHMDGYAGEARGET